MTAMVTYMDEEFSKLIQALHAKDMYKNTLIVFHSDNGGEIMAAGLCGGNNWPLTGGKFSNFEGGIRVAAFVSGGYLPEKRRGVKETGLVTVWDWYATYAGLAGVDATDHMADKAGLPPIDSINQWELIAGTNHTPPRQEFLIGDTTALTPNADGKTEVGGILVWPYKLLIGTVDHLYTVSQYVETGPNWPNISSHLAPLAHPKVCGREPLIGCLFNVMEDPNEKVHTSPNPDPHA